jgi:hypothetical protein
MKYIIALITIAALASCETMTGSIAYRDPETGIEGGVVIVDGQPTGKVTAPIYDDQGNVIGRVEIGSKPKVTATK